MDDGKGKREVYRSTNIIQPHRVGTDNASIQSIQQTGFCGATFETMDHTGLNIDTNDAA